MSTRTSTNASVWGGGFFFAKGGARMSPRMFSTKSSTHELDTTRKGGIRRAVTARTMGTWPPDARPPRAEEQLRLMIKVARPLPRARRPPAGDRPPAPHLPGARVAAAQAGRARRASCAPPWSSPRGCRPRSRRRSRSATASARRSSSSRWTTTEDGDHRAISGSPPARYLEADRSPAATSSGSRRGARRCWRRSTRCARCRRRRAPSASCSSSAASATRPRRRTPRGLRSASPTSPGAADVPARPRDRLLGRRARRARQRPLRQGSARRARRGHARAGRDRLARAVEPAAEQRQHLLRAGARGARRARRGRRHLPAVLRRATARRVESDVDRRVIGVTLEQLRAADRSVGVAGGARKYDAIHGALRAAGSTC